MNNIYAFLLTAFAGIYLIWKIYADGMHLADKGTHNRLMDKIMEQQKQLSVADGAYNSCKFKLEEANKIIKNGREGDLKLKERIEEMRFEMENLNSKLKICTEMIIERDNGIESQKTIIQQQLATISQLRKKPKAKRKAK